MSETQAVEVKQALEVKVLPGFGAVVKINLDMDKVNKAIALDPDKAKLRDKDGNEFFKIFLTEKEGSISNAGAVIPKDGVINIREDLTRDQFEGKFGNGLLRLAKTIKNMEAYADDVSTDLAAVISEVKI